MRLSRRQITFALTASIASMLPVRAISGQGSDEAAVMQAVDDLRKAMLDADKARLEQLVADQLSYGHSGGVIQTKAQFVDVIVSKKTIYKSIALTEPSVVIAGNNAIVRHIFSGETESNGKAETSHIGVLQVWQKQDDRWKLLARQGFKLPA
jgi:hypothetical protein